MTQKNSALCSDYQEGDEEQIVSLPPLMIKSASIENDFINGQYLTIQHALFVRNDVQVQWKDFEKIDAPFEIIRVRRGEKMPISHLKNYNRIDITILFKAKHILSYKTYIIESLPIHYQFKKYTLIGDETQTLVQRSIKRGIAHTGTIILKCVPLRAHSFISHDALTVGDYGVYRLTITYDNNVVLLNERAPEDIASLSEITARDATIGGYIFPPLQKPILTPFELLSVVVDSSQTNGIKEKIFSYTFSIYDFEDQNQLIIPQLTIAYTNNADSILKINEIKTTVHPIKINSVLTKKSISRPVKGFSHFPEQKQLVIIRFLRYGMYFFASIGILIMISVFGFRIKRLKRLLRATTLQTAQKNKQLSYLKTRRVCTVWYRATNDRSLVFINQHTDGRAAFIKYRLYLGALLALDENTALSLTPREFEKCFAVSRWKILSNQCYTLLEFLERGLTETIPYWNEIRQCEQLILRETRPFIFYRLKIIDAVKKWRKK
ncbi:MAG: hypothetical protein HYW78_01765 [Parcubacteria group bacterium]|nr:hypothetical protein [Parcubacteria group bacterium]